MKLKELIEILDLKVKTGFEIIDSDIPTGYSSDLLSDVMANAQEGSVWVTLQIHQNIVAVAVLKSIVGIILVNNREADESTLKKANDELIPILSTDMSTFNIVGKLYELGIKGSL